MKRPLTNEELKLEKMGLERNKRELKLLKSNLEYNKDLIAKQKATQEHDDKWRQFLREQKEYEDKQVLDTITKELEMKESLVKTAEEHIKNGVEIKNVSGVN